MFFIDHKHRLTTFIDPRLPLPDHEFTYTTRKASQSISSARRSVLYNDEPELRPHHVTTGVSSSSVSATDGATPTPPETVPTSSVTTPIANEASVSGVQENSTPLDVSSSTSTPPCESLTDHFNGSHYSHSIHVHVQYIVFNCMFPVLAGLYMHVVCSV